MKKTTIRVAVVSALICLSMAFSPVRRDVRAAVNGFFAKVDATIGYTVNGAAPSNQVICGNGTVGTYSGSCPIAAGTAAALASTPTQCSGSTPVATGIAANGNANCTSGGNVNATRTDKTGTYAAGSTYTNGTGVAVYEEVTMSVSPAGGSGDDWLLASTVNGVPGPSATLTNTTYGFQSVGFWVPAGGTFSVALSHPNGTNVATQIISKWTEVLL